jgi:hypothetical protein
LPDNLDHLTDLCLDLNINVVAVTTLRVTDGRQQFEPAYSPISQYCARKKLKIYV